MKLFLNRVALLMSLFLCVSQGFAKTNHSGKNKSTKISRMSSQKNKTINIDQQFGNLGSDQDILEKAKSLQANNSMKIVQKRAVDRDMRFELGGHYGYVSGGDAYILTQNLGASIDFHINPRWSLGARYMDSRNQLSSEGKNRFDQGTNVPSIDYPLSSYLGVINFYPLYGKVSWFESGVSQFDFYLLAGAGQVELSSGNSPIYTGGVGMGLWWTSWFSSRIEARYQNYKDRVSTGERSIDSMVFQVGIGFML